MLYIQILVSIILALLIIIYLKQKRLLMNDEEILAKLEEADQATNEIAADIQILIDNKQVSPEVAAKLLAHVDKLKGIAAER